MTKPKRQYNRPGLLMAGAVIAGSNGMLQLNNGYTTLGLASLALGVVGLAFVPWMKRRQHKSDAELRAATMTGVRRLRDGLLVWARWIGLGLLVPVMLLGLFDGLPEYFRNNEDLTPVWVTGFWLSLVLGWGLIGMDWWRHRVAGRGVVVPIAGAVLGVVGIVALTTPVLHGPTIAIWQFANPPEVEIIVAIDPTTDIAVTPEILRMTEARLTGYLQRIGQFHPPLRNAEGAIALRLAEVSSYDIRELKETIGVGYVGFHLVHPDSEALIPSVQARAPAPEGYRLVTGAKPMMVETVPVMTGTSVTQVHLGLDQRGLPVLTTSFDDDGSRRLAEVTAANIGRHLAVVSRGRVLMAPEILAAINGSMQISGDFSFDEAYVLALALHDGGLPAPLVIISENVVD